MKYILASIAAAIGSLLFASKAHDTYIPVKTRLEIRMLIYNSPAYMRDKTGLPRNNTTAICKQEGVNWRCYMVADNGATSIARLTPNNKVHWLFRYHYE